ncbi:MAG: hypothetical protein KBG75_04010 [Pseudomonadales bacterium]|nr:hypothetical protein [Pseudomonadales bacterium]
MHFLLYSRITADSIRVSLGAPEYSYFFLLKEFRPVFERLGSVAVISNPEAEADSLYDSCAARGEPCVLIAFTAPHNAPAGLRCPVVPLFAWEFERIPDETWGGNARSDWRRVLQECTRGITLSGHARMAVDAAMGSSFPVLAVPVPLWERMEPARRICRQRRDPNESLVIDGAVVGTEDYEIDAGLMLNHRPLAAFEFSIWDGSRQTLDFRLHSNDVGALIGFYRPEPWGAWSRNSDVCVALPWMLYGEVTIELVIRAYGSNQGRSLITGLGDAYRTLRVGAGDEICTLSFTLDRPARMLQITGLNTRHPMDGNEERTLGIGIARLSVSRAEPSKPNSGPVRQNFSEGSPECEMLHGFWSPDAWGSWSRSTSPWILLPQPVQGKVEVEIEMKAYGAGVGQAVIVSLGEQGRRLIACGNINAYRLGFDLAKPARILEFDGVELVSARDAGDHRSLGIGVAGLTLRSPVQPMLLDFRNTASDNALMEGFWEPESWGSWSSSETPWIVLPRPVQGRIAVEVELVAFGSCADQTLVMYVGAQTGVLSPSSGIQKHRLEFDLPLPAQVLGFTGVRLSPAGEPGDERLLGVGLASLSIESLEPLRATPATQATSARVASHVRQSLRLQGIVFTSVLNPRDDRKNWQLLISTFCAAFATHPDTTLVLKMTHHSQASYLFEFHYLLQRLPAFKCRVVILHGFLEEEAYARLIARTDYYINASKAEGLCIPLMEFMSCGKPAIAPRHTSMSDYLDDTNSLSIDAGTEPCIWPHDGRGVLRTLQYRVSWESTVEALRRSREIFLNDPAQYQRLGDAAMRAMHAYCGFDVVMNKMSLFMGSPVRAESAELRPSSGTVGRDREATA